MKSTDVLICIFICSTTMIDFSAFGQCFLGDTIRFNSSEDLFEVDIKAVNNSNLLSFSTGDTSERVIFLIPGLGGDENAWQDVHDETDGVTNEATFYEPRKASVIKFGEKDNPGYTEAVGLASAGGDLYDEMVIRNSAFNPNKPNVNIAIGHSQGGLVLRATEYYMNNTPGKSPQFGGVVTFGSPHQGAEILTNGLPRSMGGQGLISDFASELCNAIVSGPLAEELKLSDELSFKIIRLLNVDEFILELESEFCDFIFSDTVMQLALPNLTPNITTDYLAQNEYFQGSNYLINTLNNYIPNIPMVAFFGIEDEPVFWRQMGSLRKGVHSYQAFQSDYDQLFVDDANDIVNHYYAKYLKYKDKIDYHIDKLNKANDVLHVLLTPASAIAQILYHSSQREKYESVGYRYRDGYYFLRDANEYWEVIIGAFDTKVEMNGYVCECEEIGVPGSQISYLAASIDECPSGVTHLPGGIKRICSRYNNVKVIHMHKANDGIVLAESAKNLPGAIVNPQLDNLDYALEGTNHQQLRNSSETASKLIDLFETNKYGTFFITPRR